MKILPRDSRASVLSLLIEPTSLVLMYSSIMITTIILLLFFAVCFVINMSKSCFVRWFRVLSSPNPNQFPFVHFFFLVWLFTSSLFLFFMACVRCMFFSFVEVYFKVQRPPSKKSQALNGSLFHCWRHAAASSSPSLLSSFERHKNDLSAVVCFWVSLRA